MIRLIKTLGKIAVPIVVILGSLYMFSGYHVDKGIDTKAPQTAIEQHIESSEDQMTRSQRIARLFHFRQAVSEALDKRVPPSQQVTSKGIAQSMKDALVATEDKRFYEHGAIDTFGIVRALYTNVVAGQTMEGGSTITQQLVKNLFLSSKRILSRKMEEVLLAFLMEHDYSKDEIITMYLNSIYYGNNYYGIKVAAKGYFDTTPAELTIPQAALLAGLPQAPTYYNPFTNLREAKNRQRIVLGLMAEQGYIPKDSVEKYAHESLHLRKTSEE